MKGSEKQIKWAESIKSIKHINAMCDALIKKLGLTETGVAKVEEFRAFLLNNDDAKFWIENRRVFDVHSASYMLTITPAKDFFLEWLQK
ncbi:MAG: hypothetical protein ACQ5SW_01200 [Sphaerochaetaceae bacterium]